MSKQSTYPSGSTSRTRAWWHAHSYQLLTIMQTLVEHKLPLQREKVRESFATRWCIRRDPKSGWRNQLWRRQHGTISIQCSTQSLRENLKIQMKEALLSQHLTFHVTLLTLLDQLRQMLLLDTHLDFLIRR